MKTEIQKTKSLFGINEDYMELMNSIEDQDGEINDDQQKALSINREELETKAAGYIAILKYKGNQSAFISEEIKRLQAIDKRIKSTEARLKDALTEAMNIFQLDELQLPFNKLSFRKSSSVEIDIPAEELPAKLQKITITHISKTEIKEMIKAGETFEGIRIVENKNLQIK